MRTESESPVADVPRWSLWLVGLVCFAPLAVLWLLGVFARPESHRFDALSGFEDGIPAVPMIFYLVLPFTGAAWLLCKSRKVLLAEPRRDRCDH